MGLTATQRRGSIIAGAPKIEGALRATIEPVILESSPGMPRSPANNDGEGAATSGIRYENIVPCFISKHVKNLCDVTCWKSWLKAQEEFVKLHPEEAEFDDSSLERTNVTDIFKSKLQSHVDGLKPGASESFAAVVMADVSGYSNLSASLAERGAEGAEILSKTMKGYLDKVKAPPYTRVFIFSKKKY
jgi:hypothetical protein